MTTRQFDPVFSAALHNELEALADVQESAAAPRPVVRRPQVWITVVTALVLVAATLGVLRITGSTGRHAAGPAQVTDPLSQITDPRSGAFLDGAPLVLLHTTGTGTFRTTIDVPDGVPSVRPYLSCAPSSSFRLAVGKAFWTTCDAKSADSADIPVAAGRQDVTLQIPTGTAWKLVVIATPDSGTTTRTTLHVTQAPASRATSCSPATTSSSRTRSGSTATAAPGGLCTGP